MGHTFCTSGVWQTDHSQQKAHSQPKFTDYSQHKIHRPLAAQKNRSLATQKKKQTTRNTKLQTTRKKKQTRQLAKKKQTTPNRTPFPDDSVLLHQKKYVIFSSLLKAYFTCVTSGTATASAAPAASVTAPASWYYQCLFPPTRVFYVLETRENRPIRLLVKNFRAPRGGLKKGGGCFTGNPDNVFYW